MPTYFFYANFQNLMLDVGLLIDKCIGLNTAFDSDFGMVYIEFVKNNLMQK